MPHHKHRNPQRRKTPASPKRGGGAKRAHGLAPPSLLSGNGHALPDPAQFGARQKAQCPALPATLAMSSRLAPNPIRSTAEPEAVASTIPGKAHSPAMPKDTRPLSPDLPPTATPTAKDTAPLRREGSSAVPSPRPAAASDLLPQLSRIPSASPAPPRPRAVQPVIRPVAAKRSAPVQSAPAAIEAPALPLPRNDEPLTIAASPPPLASPPLERNRSLAKPGAGLLGALNGWLRATGQRLMSGFMVKKRRPVPVSLRERVELTQLRAENRRLRGQLEGMADRRGHGDTLSRTHMAQRDDVID